MAETTQIGINIRINDIKFGGFEINEYTKNLKDPIVFEKYEYQFNIATSLDDERETYTVHLLLIMLEKQTEQIKIPLAKLNMSISFVILNFEQVVLKDENELYNIPDALQTFAIGSATSSARGMLAMSVRDTILSNAILPLIDATIFVPQKTQ